jgi:hypothetical protein
MRGCASSCCRRRCLPCTASLKTALCACVDTNICMLGMRMKGISICRGRHTAQTWGSNLPDAL